MRNFAKEFSKITMVLSLLCCIQSYPADANNCGEKFSTRMSQNVFKTRRLRSRVIESHQISRALECHVKCTQNCRCLSYNVCNEGKLCELNSEKKDNEISLYEQNDECDYHEYEFNKQSPSLECLDPCCSTSNPCLLGGRCQASCLKNNKRFKCECPDGFVGNRCDAKAESCASYLQSSNKKPGPRLIFTPDNSNITVFCHFSTHFAMTLVMSYTRSAGRDMYKANPLTVSFSRNENTTNWMDYRMSLANMQAIRNNSTHWMFTCSYPTRGLVEIDYLRSKFSDTDILTYTGTGKKCDRVVEKVNIMGKSCVNCPKAFSQDSDKIFHLSGKEINCKNTLGVPKLTCGAGKHVKYFGFYNCYYEPFNCTASSISTTQLWFARYVG